MYALRLFAECSNCNLQTVDGDLKCRPNGCSHPSIQLYIHNRFNILDLRTIFVPRFWQDFAIILGNYITPLEAKTKANRILSWHIKKHTVWPQGLQVFRLSCFFLVRSLSNQIIHLQIITFYQLSVIKTNECQNFHDFKKFKQHEIGKISVSTWYLSIAIDKDQKGTLIYKMCLMTCIPKEDSVHHMFLQSHSFASGQSETTLGAHDCDKHKIPSPRRRHCSSICFSCHISLF